MRLKLCTHSSFQKTTGWVVSERHGTCSKAVKAWGRPDGFLWPSVWGIRHAGARIPAHCPDASSASSFPGCHQLSGQGRIRKDRGWEKRAGKAQVRLSDAFIAPFPACPGSQPHGAPVLTWSLKAAQGPALLQLRLPLILLAHSKPVLVSYTLDHSVQMPSSNPWKASE